eukprot:scaffold271000_cov20-Tisochrysis_lutea.AAC.2
MVTLALYLADDASSEDKEAFKASILAASHADILADSQFADQSHARTDQNAPVYKDRESCVMCQIATAVLAAYQWTCMPQVVGLKLDNTGSPGEVELQPDPSPGKFIFLKMECQDEVQAWPAVGSNKLTCCTNIDQVQLWSQPCISGPGPDNEDKDASSSNQDTAVIGGAVGGAVGGTLFVASIVVVAYYIHKQRHKAGKQQRKPGAIAPEPPSRQSMRKEASVPEIKAPFSPLTGPRAKQSVPHIDLEEGSRGVSSTTYTPFQVNQRVHYLAHTVAAAAEAWP